jgi:hypothetical protein
VHRAGEKLFVDFSGKRPDPKTADELAVELFVGVLGQDAAPPLRIESLRCGLAEVEIATTRSFETRSDSASLKC